MSLRTTSGSLKKMSSASSGLTRCRSQFLWVFASSHSKPEQASRGSSCSDTSTSIYLPYTIRKTSQKPGEAWNATSSESGVTGNWLSRRVGGFTWPSHARRVEVTVPCASRETVFLTTAGEFTGELLFSACLDRKRVV